MNLETNIEIFIGNKLQLCIYKAIDDLLSNGCKAIFLNYKFTHSTTVNVKKHKILHSSVKSQKEQRPKRRKGRI